ncbi:hypothetical protein BsIDN1_42210 [Bacillus safensis]|uniref:Uncharacterized protein n=1 Tax=Bacillus safensis TaxID=561879 RepID=A0A5S9MBW3_BACIA|nr:hypothetical protein BsIDN1_42210 [Bacillus safensis]
MGRILALVIILIPGALAALGIKLLRDTVFGIIIAPFPYLWLQGIAGLLFLGGRSLCSGWLYFYIETVNEIK